MTGFAFDPWAYLKSRERPPPPAKGANPANPYAAAPPGLAALAGLPGERFCKPEIATLPGPALPNVPPEWCEGVARLATLPAPPTIPPRRWAALAATAARLLRDHGADLHAAGWTDVDLFGLHVAAPAANPSGMGVAWLLGEHGDVLDVSPAAVGMTREAGGARLAFYIKQTPARAGVLPAWNLPGVSA